ncbi:Wzy polymerase domain-containing protein [Caenimonas sp. SL110]|uniref:PglL family O-oligosaccharyltransferase n=1 Tax=Caenimonas sp. SL110 TaxID=1450524 RepID=UPI0009E4E723|nr:Wzy polymerase domain-containing protein [Caenimonas sp. SL110]
MTLAPGMRMGPIALFLLLVIPWLSSRAGGPSTSVEPWLLSAICGAAAYGISRSRSPGWGVVGALVAFALWAILRSGVNADTVALAAACLLVFMAASIASAGSDDDSFLRAVAWAWLAAAGLSTAIALVQYFGYSDRFAPFFSGTTAGEAYGNLRQRNQFASLTVIGMATLFWLRPRHLTRWQAFAVIAWLAVGNAATTSRTGIAEMIGLAVLACIWPGERKARVQLWLVAFAAYAIAAFALPWLLDAASGSPGNRLWERVASVDSCSSRAVLWSNVLHLISQKPWTGWGWGELDYAHYMTLYDGARFCDILDNAHSLPLHLAVELGVPAAVLACLAIIWAVLRAQPWKEADGARQMAWAVLAVLGLHSLLEYPLWYGPFQIAGGLALGVLMAPRRLQDWGDAQGEAQRGQSLPDSPAFAPAFAPVLAIVAIAGCLYAAWDYRRVSQVYTAPEARDSYLRDDPLPLVRNSWLFRSQVRFAELTLTPLTLGNKEWTYETAQTALHYSPEPRVIEKLIESGTLMGRNDEMVLHLARLRAAFPDAYEAWVKAKK